MHLLDSANSTQSVVSIASGLMKATKSLQQTLDTVYVVVKEQVDTVESKVREVMAKLEEKLSAQSGERQKQDLEEY